MYSDYSYVYSMYMYMYILYRIVGLDFGHFPLVTIINTYQPTSIRY